MAYKPDRQDVLRAVVPSRCAFAQGTEACRLFVDHLRARKTGPRFALAVVGCSVHPVGRYTLYPPGHFPFGRAPVAPQSPSGALYVDSETHKPVWERTFFAAAVDAAKGESWSSESPFDDVRRRRTQGRRLDFAARLLGVHPSQDDAVREQIATQLGVPTMRLMEASRAWKTSWIARGTAIMAVLDAIPVQASLPGRILAAGTAGGLWTDRSPGRLTRSVGRERAPRTDPGSRAPPPTTSPVSAGPRPA